MTAYQLQVQSDLAQATSLLLKGGKTGDQGIENRYGAAYQAAVKAGIMPQIRRRYRVGRK